MCEIRLGGDGGMGGGGREEEGGRCIRRGEGEPAAVLKHVLSNPHPERPIHTVSQISGSLKEL